MQSKIQVVFFSLESLLVQPAPQPPKAPMGTLFSPLIEKMGPNCSLHLVCGLTADQASAEIHRQQLDQIIPAENIHWPDRAYLQTKNETDQRLYEANLENNPRFIDDYYKQAAMIKILEQNHFSPEKGLFVGHDLLLHGYYSALFSKIPVVFIKERFSFNHEPLKQLIPGLAFSRLDSNDLWPFISGKKNASNFAIIKAHATERLKKELLGDSLQKALHATHKRP